MTNQVMRGSPSLFMHILDKQKQNPAKLRSKYMIYRKYSVKSTYKPAGKEEGTTSPLPKRFFWIL